MTEAWEMSAGAYQASIGVHQPYIAEISPYQYGRLSKRGRRTYDDKRRQEWSLSAAAKAKWRDIVLAAYASGQFNLDHPRLHPEALSAILAHERRREEVARQEAHQRAMKANYILEPAAIQPGDTVFDVMCGKYGEVVKVFRKSARVKFDFPWDHERVIKCEIRRLQWKHPNDLDLSGTR